MRDELDSVTNNLPQLLIQINKYLTNAKSRELETEIGILRLDLKSKSKENSALQRQVKDLELKLKSALDNGFNQNSEDRFFKVQFQVPSEDIRRIWIHLVVKSTACQSPRKLTFLPRA